MANPDQRFSIKMSGNPKYVKYEIVDRKDSKNPSLYDLRAVFDHLSAEFNWIKLSPQETLQVIDDIGRDNCVEVLLHRLKSLGKPTTGTFAPSKLIEDLVNQIGGGYIYSWRKS